MPSAWRLTKTRFAPTAWDGEGARQAGGRWNSVGVPVVYVSATLSLALVEALVHLPAGVLPAYTAIPCEIGDAMIEAIDDTDVPSRWKDHPPPSEVQAIGDLWVAQARSAALRVPSVVVPSEFNYVLNPRHADFARVRIGPPLSFPFDVRVGRRGPRR